MNIAVIAVMVVVSLVSYMAGHNDGYVKGYKDGSLLHRRSSMKGNEGKR